MIKRETNEPEATFDIDIRSIEKILDKDRTDAGSAARALEKLKRELFAADEKYRGNKDKM